MSLLGNIPLVKLIAVLYPGPGRHKFSHYHPCEGNLYFRGKDILGFFHLNLILSFFFGVLNNNESIQGISCRSCKLVANRSNNPGLTNTDIHFFISAKDKISECIKSEFQFLQKEKHEDVLAATGDSL